MRRRQLSWLGAPESAGGTGVREFGGAQRVLQQAGDGHRTDAARHRSEGPGYLKRLLKSDVTDNSVAAFGARIFDLVDSDIDHGGSGLDPIASNQLGLTDRSNEHVRLAADLRQVTTPGMADGNRRVMLDEQKRNRHPDDVRAPKHDRPAPLQPSAGSLQQSQAARRSARDEERIAAFHGQPTEVDRMETIHVLLDSDPSQDRLLLEAAGQRKLNQNAMDPAIITQLGYECFDLLLCGFARKLVIEGLNSDLGGRGPLRP